MILNKIVNSVAVKKLFRNDILIISLLLVLLSLPPRLFMLRELPPVIVDEPAYLRDIDKILQTNQYYFALPQWDGSQAFLDYYPALFMIIFFHIDGLLAIRFSSVLYSILGILFFFFLARIYTNNKIAFLVSLLFSSSYYYLQFSRVGWNVIHALSLGLGALLFAILATRGKHQIFFSVMAGVLASLCFYTYRSGEIYIACCFLVFIIEAILQKNKKIIYSLVVFSLVFFELSIPWLFFIIQNWDVYTLRNDVVSIFHTNLPYMNLTAQSDILFYQVLTTINSWIFMLPVFGNNGHVENPRYLPLIVPLLSLPLIPLYLFGLYGMIRSIKIYYPYIFIFVFGLIFSQIFTVFPPNGARGLIVLPIIYLAITISMLHVFKKFKSTNFAFFALCVFSCLVSFADIIFYFYWMSWITV